MQAGGPGWLHMLLPGSSGGVGGVGTVRTGEADGQGLSGPTRGELNPSCTLTGGGSEFGTVIYWFSLNHRSPHLYNGGNGDEGPLALYNRSGCIRGRLPRLSLFFSVFCFPQSTRVSAAALDSMYACGA